MKIPYNKVSRLRPNIAVNIAEGVSVATASLRVYRVGEVQPFAEYPATLITGTAAFTELRFTFDELLFSREFGRFVADLYINGVYKESITFQYIDNEKITVKVT